MPHHVRYMMYYDTTIMVHCTNCRAYLIYSFDILYDISINRTTQVLVYNSRSNKIKKYSCEFCLLVVLDQYYQTSMLYIWLIHSIPNTQCMYYIQTVSIRHTLSLSDTYHRNDAQMLSYDALDDKIQLMLLTKLMY